MRIMFLTHLPENPKAKERYAKIQAQLNGYASAGTQVDLCFPDDYPGAKLSVSLGARNEVPGIYHVLQTPAIIRKDRLGREERLRCRGSEQYLRSGRGSGSSGGAHPGYRRVSHGASRRFDPFQLDRDHRAPRRAHRLRLADRSLPTGCRALSKISVRSVCTTKLQRNASTRSLHVPLRSCAPRSRRAARAASFHSVAQWFQPLSLPRTWNERWESRC